MATYTHRCSYCDSDYVCDSMVEGEDEHGHPRSACDCREKDTCPLCSDHPCRPLESEPDPNGVSLSERMDSAYDAMAARRR
jgi:hypothetical protein